MKLFTGVSHFINFLLIFCNADGGVCRCNGGDDAGSHGVSVREIVVRIPFGIQPGCLLVPWVVGEKLLHNCLSFCDLVGPLCGLVHLHCGPEHLLFDLFGLRCGLAVRLDVERLLNPLVCLLRPLGDLSRLPDDP